MLALVLAASITRSMCCLSAHAPPRCCAVCHLRVPTARATATARARRRARRRRSFPSGKAAPTKGHNKAAKAPAVQEQEAAAAVKVQAIHRGNTVRWTSVGPLIPRKELSLVLPGEVNIAELALPRPLVLWCSAGNPGAAAMAHELKDALPGGGDAIQVVERWPDARVLEAVPAADA